MRTQSWSMVVLAVAVAARADVIPVAPGESIQAAIVAATPGDVIAVAAGTFDEDLDFLGKAIVVRGAGPATVVRGTGSGPVVRFASGEGPGSVLDAVTVTGGLGPQGGGIYVRGASPTIVRNTMLENRAVSQGSGVYVEASAARIYNNLIAYSTNAGGDPHSLQIVGASPTVVNNTIVRGDSNGILVSGASSFPVIMNNIIAYNGARPDGDELRGHGICDFGPATVLQWNLFFRNRRGAILSGGIGDIRRIRRAELVIADPRLANNIDGPTRFVRPELPDFALRPSSRAIDAGNPDPAFADADGSRNDLGHGGGPYAWPATTLP